MKRKIENRGLPRRWCFQHGAFYYFVPPGLEKEWDGRRMFRLGATLREAHQKYSERVGPAPKSRFMRGLFDRYTIEEIPIKEPKTQVEYLRYIVNLRKAFDDMAPEDLRPQHIYKYIDKRSGKVAARREAAVLSHVFTKAIEWGDLDKHPFKGQIRLKAEKPRTRYVHDWEILEILAMPTEGADAVCQAYIKLKLLTGMSRGDLLRLTTDQASEEGIQITRHKTRKTTGKQTLYEWSDELMDAYRDALSVRPTQFCKYVFCTRRGASYMDESTGEAEGWKSNWQRFIEEVKASTGIKERFTEHDLRAKVGSDADSLDHARMLLSHASTKTTERHYRRKAERVKPMR